MTQTFFVSIPADTNYHNLYTLISASPPLRTYSQGSPAVTGTEKGIIPNQVQFLSITPGGSIQVKTSFAATQAGETPPTGTGIAVASGVGFTIGAYTLNSIGITDYWVAGSGVSLSVLIQSR